MTKYEASVCSIRGGRRSLYGAPNDV